MTASVIQAAWKKTGLFPFDANVFADADFAPSHSTSTLPKAPASYPNSNSHGPEPPSPTQNAGEVFEGGEDAAVDEFENDPGMVNYELLDSLDEYDPISDDDSESDGSDESVDDHDDDTDSDKDVGMDAENMAELPDAAGASALRSREHPDHGRSQGV